jgi:CBS domain-containing protein
MERISESTPALGRVSSPEGSGAGQELTTPVGALITRAPLVVGGEASVAEAARAMREAGTSAALVGTEPPGILTDADLRSRVLAEGLSPDTPVWAVMSRPLVTLPAETPLFEALRRMLDHEIHHLPVTHRGEIVAVLGDTDLLRHQTRSPLALLNRIEHLQHKAEVSGYAAEVMGVAATLFAGGLGVVQISGAIASLGDVLARRLLTLAELELGPPPCPYAWMVLGSEGRMEQVLLTDQDNAIAYLEDSDEARDYFAQLAAGVIAGLVRAGFPPCPGGYMATNWCRPIADWKTLFRRWVDVPEPQALLDAQIFFDFRGVHGDLSLEPLEEILLSAGRRGLFLAHLARAALRGRPPLRFPGRRLRSDDGRIDLKAGGIAPAVMLARAYALAARSGARPTLERLSDAAEAGTLSRSAAEILAESFRFLIRLRLQEQLRSARAGEEPSNRVRVEALTDLERRRLAEAFEAVRKLQDATALRFNAGGIA